ncbi:MAG: phosphoribosyltransferase family protein [Alphaproteobacteria bacterium]|nr:phosphoribosyltransferase family protein [Alphaproteobacteria bacterium]
MKTESVLREFRAAGALLDGHFLLSSGLHSRHYLQAARVLMDAKRAAKLARALTKKIQAQINKPIDYVISPAMGGIIIGHEVGRQLAVPAMFLERTNGIFHLRRGFDLKRPTTHKPIAKQKPTAKNKPTGTHKPTAKHKPRVLMVEDIVTTGLSSREAIAAIRRHGGVVVGAACLIDRSNGKAKMGVKLCALAKLHIETFKPNELPADLQHMPAVKPGSRDGAS